MRDFQSVNSATLPVADLLATMGRESGHRHLRSPTMLSMPQGPNLTAYFAYMIETPARMRGY